MSEAYMYFMLLRKLGWMVSGYHLKIYITNAQLRLAKTGHALALIFVRVSSDNMCAGMSNVAAWGLGSMEIFARASMTRAKT